MKVKYFPFTIQTETNTFARSKHTPNKQKDYTPGEVKQFADLRLLAALRHTRLL